MISESVRAAVEAALGASIGRVEPLSGGDINDAFLTVLVDGRRVFVKTHQRADPGMFPAEARGLTWLREAVALRIPEVLAVSDGSQAGPHFLALEYLHPAKKNAHFDEQLGRGLADLHRFGAPRFGLDHDNFIGSLPQNNSPSESWTDFYRERRLRAQLILAVDSGRLDTGLTRRFENLLSKLAALLGPPEPPSRLHGDLWGGNLHVDEQGAPCLLDPAAYGGHREVDLAMMRLFGGFAARSFQAYAESFPLAPGSEERVALYQLYPVMVHLNLFGKSYSPAVERTVERYT
jgi:fructosamine-3-kinase